MIFVKVSDESFVEDKPRRGPGSFLGTVALPVHQVLEVTTLMTTVQDAADGVRLASINDTGGWGGWGGGGSGAGHKGWVTSGSMSRKMERGMYSPHGSWNSESNRSRADDP